jgi:UDP-glucuronate decarboxylase
MRILVTGGAGFIGSHLCELLLERGQEVVCLDNLFTSRRENIAHLIGHRNFEFMRHDVCEPWHVECDRIYHLACPASPVHYQRNPVRTIETAVLGTRNALECARSSRARLLITSTSEVYGDPESHPQKEEYVGHVNTLGPRACYDEGKRVGESLATSWASQFGTDVRIARLFNTYGPRMAFEDGRLIPNFVLQAMRKKPLTVYGDGRQTRSFCYVSDTVDGIVRLMEMERPDSGVPVVNIGNPDERTIESVARDVIEAFGEGSIEHKSLPADDPKQRCPDISRAKRLLGWQPRVDYSEGIQRTISWFRAQETERVLGASRPDEDARKSDRASFGEAVPPRMVDENIVVAGPFAGPSPAPKSKPAARPLRIAFLFDPWACTRPINASALFSDSRGLTGSEVSFVMQAIEMKRRGHDVVAYTNLSEEGEERGVKFLRWNRWVDADGRKDWDAAIAFIHPGGLQYVKKQTLRVFNQQVNDFQYCPGWQKLVDVATSPSPHHQKYLETLASFPRWEILPNGCDPSIYEQGLPRSRSIVYASSPDRGLHWVLELFPRLKRQVPDVQCHVYYDYRPGIGEMYERCGEPELARRFRYIDAVMPKLAARGVQHHKSVSREQMAKVLSTSRLLAYPCDTVRYTEGFSCTTLEAAVAGCLPVIVGTDALSEIYSDRIPVIAPPYEAHRQEYFDALVKYLTDDAAYEAAQEKARGLGKMYDWSAVGERLQSILEKR